MTDELNPEAVAEHCRKLRSQIGDDAQEVYLPEALHKGSIVLLEALAARLAEVEAERDKLEKQILKDRPLRQNTIDDATMWRFSVDMGEQTSTVVKIWEQRKEAISRAEAAEAELSRLRTAQDAMVGAAYEAAAKRFEELWRETSAYQAAQIRALTPPDATASLQRMLREARNAALDRAAKAVPQDPPYGKADGDMMRGREIGYKDAAYDARSAILALKEQPE